MRATEVLRAFFFEQIQQKKIALCRALLGFGLFVFYFSFVFDRPPFLGVPRFAGFEIPFLHLPLSTDNPQVSIVFYLLALASSLAFTCGYRTRVSGFIALVLHLLFYGNGTGTFGWGALIDPFLIIIILSPSRLTITGKIAAWPLRLLQLSVCIMYLLAAWGQLTLKPWLEPSVIDYYVHGSPLTHVFAAYRGFIPLVEIFGGFAWLSQMVAPILLWQRVVSKYLAVMLIVLHGLLEIFMPAYFWNYVMMVALISFMPEEWLTLNRSYWSVQIPKLKIACRNLSFFFIIATMVVTIFQRNIVQQFDVFEKIKNKTVESAYRVITQPFVDVGNLILFNSMWKMYSPTWRHVVWIEWYYKKMDQSVENWPQENFSPDYRMHRRTWLEALWTDFKKEKVFVGMLSGSQEKAAYGKYLCHEIFAKTGSKPISVHPEIYSFDIRGPEEDWSLKTQSFENRDVKEEVPCD